jgi:putative ABC transport system ATP-binding protein
LQAYNLVPYLTISEQFKLVDHVKKEGNLSADDLQALLAQLDISNLVNKYPQELSGGQQQRAAIARALYADPAVIMADEPTASLDSERVAEVGQLFKDLAKQRQKAIILVTHDDRLTKYADHIYDMLDGRLTKRQ